jgi:membrane-associated phospholipid phosphatase
VIVLLASSNAQNADINLLKRLYDTHDPGIDNFFVGLSHSAAPVSITTPITFFTVGAIKKNDKIKWNSYEQAGAIILSSLISVSFKYSVDRERPYEKYSFILPKIKEHTPSFPSGHTTSAFTTATLLTLQYPKWYIAVPAYAWASTIAYSRMRLGVHYPSDVLGGIIIGTGSSLLVHALSRKMEKRKKENPVLE